MRDLQREQLSFRNSCRLFLGDIALRFDLDVDDIEPMIQDKDDARWKQGAWLQPDVLDLESVQGYLETVEHMKELLTTIRDRLGLQENSLVSLKRSCWCYLLPFLLTRTIYSPQS
jgi:hypothetical protein